MNKIEPFRFETQMIGPLPIVNHFTKRIGLNDILGRYLNTANTRKTGPSQSIGVLLRNIILNRTPIYDLQKWASGYQPELFGPDQITSLNDDKVGLDLGMLFDADRVSLLTEVVVRAIKKFNPDLSQFHNDSITIIFSGIHKEATGERKQGKESLNITFCHNKDHRPDSNCRWCSSNSLQSMWWKYR